MVHAEAEGRALGAMEERSMCSGHCPSACREGTRAVSIGCWLCMAALLERHGGEAARALRLEEREEISRGIAAGRSIRQIAQGLARSPSTVSREIRRNGGSAYRASWADRYAWQRALRPKPVAARHAELLDGASRRSSRSSGRRSRSPAGWSGNSLPTR